MENKFADPRVNPDVFAKAVNEACASDFAPVALYHILIELLRLSDSFPKPRAIRVQKAENRAGELVKMYRDKYSMVVLEESVCPRMPQLLENVQKALKKMRPGMRQLLSTVLLIKLTKVHHEQECSCSELMSVLEYPEEETQKTACYGCG